MKKTRIIRIFKKLHKWPSIIIAGFVILFAFSGIFMNHRAFFSPVDVSRKLLPPNYTYKNWNLAAVRGSVKLGDNSFLMYGNIGIWKTSDNYQTFSDFNQGFPVGIDNRKIYSVVQLKEELYAGTHFGLYKRKGTEGIWEKIPLPVHETRIADLAIKENELLVLTRHYLLSSADGDRFNVRQLPPPIGYERKTGLFETFWELHSGELFGLPGKLVVDLLGIVVIVLSVTGLLHFFFPKIIRKRKKNDKSTAKLVETKKLNLRWHNVVGYIFVLFVMINTFAGMHLRPPLLIAIAGKKVGIIPKTHMDSPNPWFDKLRRVQWNAENRQYIFSTTEGFYFAEETLTNQLVAPKKQPVVSVMGCNVFEPAANNIYLVGSFNGLFFWNTKTGAVADFFTRQPYQAPEKPSSPIAENMVAGYVQGNDAAWWFDYNRGVLPLQNIAGAEPFPDMSAEIRKKAPMSLWNVSLEVHTGRIFEHLVGPFYILYVPLAGICILLVLLSGFFVWWFVYRKK